MEPKVEMIVQPIIMKTEDLPAPTVGKFVELPTMNQSSIFRKSKFADR
jgi:hypothetical protein